MLQWDDGDAAAVVNIEALGRVIALDTLTLNNDRHQGNLIVQALAPGQLLMWAIDSGNGWSRKGKRSPKSCGTAVNTL